MRRRSLMSCWVKTIWGYIQWRRLRKRYKIDEKTVIVVMDPKNQELNVCAIKYLKYYMKRKCANKALIISEVFDRQVKGLLEQKEYVRTVECHTRTINALMQYYCYKPFNPQIAWVSLDKPFGNEVYKFIGKKGIDYRDVVCLAVYQLREVFNEE